MTEPTPEQIEAAYSAFMRSNAGDRSAIKDAITAALAARPVPDGWQAVPKEPCDEIMAELYGPWLSPSSQQARDKAWKAALAAAPTQED